MIDTLRLQGTVERPSLTRAEFARCARAIRHGMIAMEAGGAFSAPRSRSLVYRRRVRLALRKIIQRIWYGLDGFEDHTSVATARGLGAILGIGKSATHAILKLLWRYGLIEHATPNIRRGAAKTISPTHGSSAVWWCPSHWRIGPTLLEFFAEGSEDGADLAESPLGNQNRTENSLTGVGISPTSTLHPEIEAQGIQNLAEVSSGFLNPIGNDPSITEPYRPLEHRSPVPAVRVPLPADPAQEVSQAIQGAILGAVVQFERNPVHPEGADLGRVLNGKASPEVVARVRQRQALDRIPDPEHERRKARIVAEAQAEAAREAAQPPPLPPDPTTKPSGLEAVIARFAQAIGIRGRSDDG